MVERKSPFGSKKGGFKSRNTGRTRSEGRSGSASYRNPVPPRKAGVPTGAVIAIALPLVAILFFVVFGGSLFKDTTEVKVHDPNANIRALEKRASGFQREYNEVRKMIQSEDAGAASRSQNLDNRLFKWLQDWDRIMKPFQDADGYLKKEYKGYNSTRQTVSRIRHDLSKSKGFFDE